MPDLVERLKREVVLNFTLSQGAGGQNVNKVATAVQLRFDVLHSGLISEQCRRAILTSGDARLTQEGVLVIRAQEHRTQAKNIDAALARLAELIQRSSVVPKKRRPTRPTRASKERRLKRKSARAQIKRGRGPVQF